MESPGGHLLKKVSPWTPFENFDALRGPIEQQQ
jgi:hypothetical protein